MQRRFFTLIIVLLAVPMAAACLGAVVDPSSLWSDMIRAYGFGILMLIAGVRFGMHFGRHRSLNWHQWVIYALPVVALIAIFLPVKEGLAVLILAFGAAGAIDVWGGHLGLLPDRYAAARLWMTVIFCACLIVVLLLGRGAISTV